MRYANGSSLSAPGDRVPEQSRICQECQGKSPHPHPAASPRRPSLSLHQLPSRLLLLMIVVCLLLSEKSNIAKTRIHYNTNYFSTPTTREKVSFPFAAPLSLTLSRCDTLHWQSPLSHMDCCPQSVQVHTVKMGVGMCSKVYSGDRKRKGKPWGMTRRQHITHRAPVFTMSQVAEL